MPTSRARAPVGEQLQEVVDADAAAVEIAGRADLAPLRQHRQEVVDADGAVEIVTVPRAVEPLAGVDDAVVVDVGLGAGGDLALVGDPVGVAVGAREPAMSSVSGTLLPLQS